MEEVNVNLDQLFSAGYTVVQSALSPDDLNSLRDLHKSVSNKKRFLLPRGQISAEEWFRARSPSIQRRLDQIQTIVNANGGNADTMGPRCSFIVRKTTQLGLHSDHGMHFSSQGAEHCIRVWIPIIKPCPESGGMDVVRMDAFIGANPQLEPSIRDKGAIQVDEERNVLMVRNVAGDPVEAPFSGSISDYLDTPRVAEGDVLLLLGHTFHRTSQIINDADWTRIALGFHWHWGDKIIKWEHVHAPARAREILGRAQVSAMLVSSWRKGGDFLFRDYRETCDRIAQRNPMTLLRFLCAYALEPFYHIRTKSRSW